MYAPADIRRVGDTGSLDGCTALLVLLPDEHPLLVAEAEGIFGPPLALPATTTGLLFR